MTSIEFAKRIRRTAISMVHRAHASHIGGALSMTDILAVLYSDRLNVRPAEPQWEGRDRLLLSKGHACVSLYAALALKGFFPYEKLLTLNQPGTDLPSHCDRNKTPGVDMTTGSLGQGISTANGSNISGDPGAAAEYAWSITMTVPANAGIVAKTCQIVVTDDGGNTSTCTITLAAGDATLSVSPASVDIPWDGSTSAQFTVESNTNWTVD